MLLERIDDLPLSQHDLRGNPSALLGSVVGRIDRLKDELITADDYAAWAATLPEDTDAARARAMREREFAAIYAAHDRMLAEAGTLDFGDLVLHAFRVLRERPHVRARLAQRFRHVLVDEFQDTNFAQGLLLRLLAGRARQRRGRRRRRPGDLPLPRRGDQEPARLPGRVAGVKVVALEQSFRCRPARSSTRPHAVVAPNEDRLDKALDAGAAGGEVAFWRAANERAQAQAVGRRHRAPDHARRRRARGRRRARALGQGRGPGGRRRARGARRALPVAGAAAFFQRAEVRDLLAWLRLLVDPGDAGAVVRALARPPIELRSIDLARVTQIARRRKLDMVGALGAAMESPQIPPEARERILAFLKLYRSASGALDSTRPDLFVHRMIERLGLRRQLLFAATRRGRRAAREPREVRRARGDLRAPLARRRRRGTSPARSPPSPRPGCARRRRRRPTARAACR